MADETNTLETLFHQGQFREGETLARSLTQRFPEHGFGWKVLGAIFMKQGRLKEALATMQQAVNLQPDDYAAQSNLGLGLMSAGRFPEAEICYRTALALKEDLAEVHNNLGIILKEQGRFSESEACYRRALELKPDYFDALNNLGNNLQSQGRLDEAETSYRRALEIKPDYAVAFGNLLFLLNYHPYRNAEEIYKEYTIFNTRFGLPFHGEWQLHRNSTKLNRRLKVGYVSPQFGQHPVCNFLEPLLAHHDKKVVEIYAYAEMTREDAVTERYKTYVNHWVSTIGLTDMEMARCIRNDGIDILVDLAGHTTNNRLGVFARKPAPVSLHWLDFGYTTGLTAIDYYLADSASVPTGAEGLFSERPWRLATPAFAYRPAKDMGKVGPLPARERGYITFGTLTRAVRINQRTIRVWAEILQRVPGSHLVINSGSFRDPVMQTELAGKFAAYGIDRERLEIGCNSPPWDVLRGLDIGLDCFPHNSGTTLFETLYMGVPFITLADRPSVGRLGSSVLEGVGHPEWIARTEEEYVELALALATDLTRLATLRAGLRAEMESGPLMDEPGFARKIEQAYSEMFAQWCKEVSIKKGHCRKKGKSIGSDTVVKEKIEGVTEPAASEVNQLVAFFDRGHYGEAENLARSLINRFPDHAFGWKVLGVLLKQQGRLEEALAAMQRAVTLQPDDCAAQSNMGLGFLNAGRFAEAEISYRKALALNPDHTEARNNLGIALKEQGRLAEAEACYRQALELDPTYAEAAYNLGNILQRLNQPAEAERWYRRALQCKPEFAEALNNLGVNLQKQRQLNEAETCFLKALELRPHFAEAYNNLGITLQDQGRAVEAEACYRKALELNPEYSGAFSNLLFVLNYDPDKSSEELYEEYRNFNARFGLPLQATWQPHPNNRRADRCLKVGYVSGDFTFHPVRHLLEPLLAHHDKKSVEVYAYAEVVEEDAATAKYREYADHWISTAGMTDEQLAARIRADGIDILVDLAGHTAKNRLGVFARKPAPVSVSWLGYGYTTGMTAIDYFLTDLAIVPAGSEELFAETPWRLAAPSCAYRPAEGMGEVNALPAMQRGHVTFGTLTRAIRINHRTIRAWAEILRRVPGSHLVINSGNFKDPAMQASLADKFVAEGIDRARLEIGCTSPPWDVLRGMDIGLDCFPHNSGTTLFESLYMGVPFVTLAGRPSMGRLGACILEGVGHPEWIARSEEEYVESAVTLAGDLPRLAALRAGLREEMAASPLMDEPGFARKVEDAYHQMFARWCEKEDGALAALDFDQLLQEAISLHQAGRPAEAEVLYLKVRDARPAHVIVNHNLGLLAVQRQDPVASLPYFEAALDADPTDGGCWLRYIDALAQAGRTESAREILELARQSGLEGEEMEGLAARLAIMPEEIFGTKQEPEEQEPPRNIAKKKGRKTRSEKVSGNRKGVIEPSADDINRLTAYFTQGHYEKAEELARTIIQHFPQYGFAWKVLGPVLKIQGRLTEALTAMQQAVVLLPHDYGAYYNLGIAYQDQGRLIEAEASYRQVLELQPSHVEAHNKLGNVLNVLGRFDEAEGSLRSALELKPDFAEAYNNLGITLYEQGRLDEAVACYQKALSIRPDFVEPYNNLGNTFSLQGRFSEAEESYRHALQLKPDYANVYYNLGNILKTRKCFDEAEICYCRALEFNPNFAEACNNLGATLKENGRILQAEEMYRRALELNPTYAEAYNNLGTIFSLKSEFDIAEETFRYALHLKPDYKTAHDNLLFALNYHPDKAAEEIYEEYKRYNARFALTFQAGWQPHSNSRRADRRLKVGYVSPQFNHHPVRNFLEPLLAHHDKREVEIFAYAEVVAEDAATARYREYADHWLSTVGMSDEQLAVRIRDDGIDILVDLAGHTAHNRLGVFARKPAPVSLHWLDFGYTTGLTAIDYYLADSAQVPMGNENLFSEQPWRLATPAFAYRPTEGMGEVSELPALQRGHVTFGTLTRAVRINHRTIRVWAEILRRVPGSHLVINSGNFKDPAMQSWLADKFVAQGIDREQLEIGYTSPPWDVLRGMDIGLDCFPHNSGTTLFENLYMGVPFVTLADRPSVGRLGACILEGVGHPEWIARSEEEYVESAVALAGDLPRLAALRAGLRGEMIAGPLMDEPGFARKVETAYREMFARWCGKEDGALAVLDFDQLLQEAINRHQAGRLAEAEVLYLKLRDTRPAHVIVNHNLGLLAVQRQDPEASLPYFEAALDMDPTDGDCWLTYIDALVQAGRTESAREILELARQSGLQGKEVEALEARLTMLPPAVNDQKADSSQGAQGGDKRKKEKKAKSAKVSDSRQGVVEPAAEEVQRLVDAYHRGHYPEAENLALILTKRYPRHGFAWMMLGPIYKQQGRAPEALAAMHQAVALLPDDYNTHYNLGLLLQGEGRYVEAEGSYRRALEIAPQYPDAHNNLGNTLKALGRFAESEQHLRMALKLKPDFAEAYNSLGNTLKEQGRGREAEESYRCAVRLKPDLVVAHSNLGNVLKDQGRLTEADACYRQALALKPDYAEVHYNLGNTLLLKKQLAEAEACFYRALQLRPDFAEAENNLGVVFKELGLLARAEERYSRALESDPQYAEAYSNLGSIFSLQGRFYEAESSLRRALQLKPDYAKAHSNLLFLMNYHPDKSGDEIFQLYREFDTRFGLPLRQEWRPHRNSRDRSRRLKIGYVSPQFCKHPVRHFLEPLLAHHDKEMVEVYAYAELYTEDAVTNQYRRYVDHWVVTSTLSDIAMVERIRADEIDVLIDLAGHTGGNRLGVFARKPAPVSLHWLDFGYTTGLTAIDYYLADNALAPMGSEALFSETPWRVATPSYPYRPAEGMGEVSALPAKERGYVTFGTLTRAVRINYRTIRVWAEILQRVPGSRLVIDSGIYKDPKMQNKLAEKFAAHGIAGERLEIGCHSPPWDVLRGMDIGFDCFPHNSGTTLFETLYMGVPFVTLAGRPSVGRLGACVLEGVGHPEWIARTEEEYVECAVALATDLPRLELLRSGLRAEMAAGPLMDEPGFARKFEAAYREMFAQWCEKQQ